MICIYNKILREHYIQFVLSSSPEPKTSRESCDDGDNIVAGGDVIHELLGLHWKWSECIENDQNTLKMIRLHWKWSGCIENDQAAAWGMIFTKSLDGGEYFATGGSLRTRMKGAWKKNFSREWRMPEKKFGDNERVPEEKNFWREWKGSWKILLQGEWQIRSWSRDNEVQKSKMKKLRLKLNYTPLPQPQVIVN